MGTIIELQIAGLTLDSSKNHLGVDYGEPYQKADLCQLNSDQIDYQYYVEHPDEDLAETEASFARSLSRIIPRLNLLGHTIEAAKAEYENVLQDAWEIDETLDGTIETSKYMNFEEFCTFACLHPLESLSDTTTFDDDKVSKGRFLADETALSRIPYFGAGDSFWSEKSYFGSVACILSAYSMLQIFGLNLKNANSIVTWQYGPIVDSGWVNLDAITPCCRRTQTILIATEGSSDVHILKHALKLLRPDIADFFRFIDVNESHPFSGTGSLLKFAEGLTKIDVHNRVVFLLDNDAEGVSVYRKMIGLGMPRNMNAMVLPDDESFRNFPAKGPEGVTKSDINGRAAAIECYLDLSKGGIEPAEVLWSNYKKDIDSWQGALQNKEAYAKQFLSLNILSYRDSKYETSKIERVLDAITETSIKLSTASQFQLT